MGYLVRKTMNIIRENGYLLFVKRMVGYLGRTILNILALPKGIYKIKKLGSCQDIDLLIDFVFLGCHGLITLLQKRSEIDGLLKILAQKKPKYILEIGTAGGGTLFLLTKMASQNAIIISLDLGPSGGGYPAWKIPLYKSFVAGNQKMHLIMANSQNQTTKEKVKNILKNNLLDFLFIDGDHSYKGVAKDFTVYSPLVKQGGIIAFHDIIGNGSNEVPFFWNEIKYQYNHLEFIEDINQGGYGIGIIFLD